MSMSTNKSKQQMIARKRRLEAARLQRRRKRPAQWPGGTIPAGPTCRGDVPDGVKMSEVLEEFVEPFAAEVAFDLQDTGAGWNTTVASARAA